MPAADAGRRAPLAARPPGGRCPRVPPPPAAPRRGSPASWGSRAPRTPPGAVTDRPAFPERAVVDAEERRPASGKASWPRPQVIGQFSVGGLPCGQASWTNCVPFFELSRTIGTALS
ncbi:hypothetical protein Shyhy01_62400 [Streptomyces hygroscopicus subsp. hygroscopicus]|nr:hypothetical protein Shyhy01_62400 [Streptomyces hygroscopicus subsp. hygroscopicus]